MAVKVKINSKTEPVFPCFMALKHDGGIFHIGESGRKAYCIHPGTSCYWHVGELATPDISKFKVIPNPFAKPEPEYTFPILMTHKEYGGVYKFYGPTERVCIDAGMAPLVAVHRIDSDITCYELFNGEVLLSNE